MKRIGAVLLAAVAGLTLLSGCGRSIDKESTGAQAVNGARGLNRFCDGPTLIYVSIWEGSDDDYEAMWPGWCLWNEQAQKWEYDPAKLKNVPGMRVDGNTTGDNK
jgi:hypothetical protein